MLRSFAIPMMWMDEYLEKYDVNWCKYYSFVKKKNKKIVEENLGSILANISLYTDNLLVSIKFVQIFYPFYYGYNFTPPALTVFEYLTIKPYIHTYKQTYIYTDLYGHAARNWLLATVARIEN